MGRRGRALPLLEGMQGYISLFIGQEQGARLKILSPFSLYDLSVEQGSSISSLET